MKTERSHGFLVKFAFALVMIVSPLTANAAWYQGCDPCNPANPCDPCGSGCGAQKSLWSWGGWGDAGITVNNHGQNNAYAGGTLSPYSGNTGLLQNVRQSDFQLNQAWLYGEKKVSGRGLDFGGRIDFAYGTDAVYLQSSGLEMKSNGASHWGSGDYYAALPQLYGEVGYNNFSLKVGKLFNPLGYESLQSPNRFFYSQSYSRAVLPHTVTGVVGTWYVNPGLTVYVAGGNGEKFYNDDDDNAFVGGFTWQASRKLSLSYGLIAGSDSDNDYDYFMQSFVADYKINRCWNYVFEWTLRNDKAGAQNLGAYGINQELFYTINRCLALGFRADWMSVYNYGILGNGALPISDDALAFTVGLNWKPTQNFTLRPEIRYDALADNRLFNMTKSNYLDPKKDQWTFGLSGVLVF